MRTGRILLTLSVGLLWGLFCSYGQQLNVGNVFYSTAPTNTQHGINAAYMFHHILDENYALSSEMEAAVIGTDYDVVRFPGGAIGNYYRFNGPGYGALKNEVQSVANTVVCNGSGAYCFERDQFAPRNFVYDFLELMDSKYSTTGKPTDVLYMLNLLLHFVYNYSEIPELDNINDLAALDEALAQGTISQDFHTRIMENYNAMALIIQNPNLRITGIEMGNEFYFYQEVTTFPYPPTNSNPFFSLGSALNTIEPRIANYLSLIKFYKRLIQPLEPAVQIGVPIGGINHFGNQANADLLWNTAIKQWVMQDVDALIPHLYVKTTAPETNPPSVAVDDDNNNLLAIKEGFEESLDTKFLGILREITEFFGLSNNFRELWMTEYNVNKNSSSSQIWDEWTNTYLHGAFLTEMMKRMTASEYSHYMTYSIQHAWSGGETSYEHCMLSRKNNADIIERIAWYSNSNTPYLKSLNTVKLNGTLTDNMDSWDLYADAYYTYRFEDPSCPTERFILSFSNLRSDIVAANLNFDDGLIVLNNKTYEVISGTLKAFQGQNLASSCGRTEFDNDETRYDIQNIEFDISVDAPINIPAYTTGCIDLVIRPVNLDCVPLALDNFQFDNYDLLVYPNPATRYIKVDLSEDTVNRASHLTITNALGQEVRRVPVTENIPYIRLNGLDKGVYFIQAVAGSQRTGATPFIKF